MALADTLSLAAFYDLLPIGPDGLKFNFEFMQERSLTGGGDRLVADRAPALLMAEITTMPVPDAEAESIMALLNSRAGGLKQFLLTNPRLPYPSSDPTGSIFGAATPVVGVITNRLVLAFTGFPNGYSIPRGTWFQILFDTSRYYLGQFAEAKTANGSGAVSAVEVYPPLPAGIGSGAAVTVKRPAGKFKPVAGSAYISSVNQRFSRVTFSAEQTYAAG